MKLTLRDTVTGREAVTESDDDTGYWSSGNGSCDCNRISEFPDLDEALDRALRAANPELPAHVGMCYGAQRVLIVACDDPRVSLHDLNECYPAALTAQHLPQ